MKKTIKLLCSIVVMTIIGLSVNAEIITGKDGTTYDVLSVAKTNAMGIVVNTTVNARGQSKAWIPYNNMTPTDQQRFGFDQQKYDEYIRHMAEGDKTLADDPNATPTYRTPKAMGTVTQYVIPKTTTREQYLQRQMQNNPIQGNQVNAQGASGVTPVVAGGVNSQAAAVATPVTYAGVSTTEAKASMPGAGVAVSQQGLRIDTPIVGVGISPYGIGVNTPVTNAVVSTNVVGVQTPVGGIYLTPGGVPEPIYYPSPTVVGSVNGVPIVYTQPVSGPTVAQIPLMGIPVGSPIQPVVIYSPVITATDCPQPVYPNYVAGPVYANPVVYTGSIQQPVINYAGAFSPFMQSYGYSTFGYSANYGWSGNPYYYNGSCYGGYRGWGSNVWGGYRGGAYTGGGWSRYVR